LWPYGHGCFPNHAISLGKSVITLHVRLSMRRCSGCDGTGVPMSPPLAPMPLTSSVSDDASCTKHHLSLNDTVLASMVTSAHTFFIMTLGKRKRPPYSERTVVIISAHHHHHISRDRGQFWSDKELRSPSLLFVYSHRFHIAQSM
jgi:hypothetical protein